MTSIATMNWLLDMTVACNEISEANLCSECPMNNYCLMETNFIYIAAEVSAEKFDAFLEMGDNPTSRVSAEDEYINANYMRWKEEYYEDKYGREE